MPPPGSLRLPAEESEEPAPRSVRAPPPRSGWRRPTAPFDASTSMTERMTLTYDAVKDKHLNKPLRRKAASARAATSRDEYTRTWDGHVKALARSKDDESLHRSRNLSRLYNSNHYLYARTWDLWPKNQAYYPTSIGAGGADINSIQRAMSIYSPKVDVPCDSVLSPYSKDFVSAFRDHRPATSGSPRGTGKAGLDVRFDHLLAERQITESMAISPSRSLRGTSWKVRRKVTEPGLPTARKPKGIDYSAGKWLQRGDSIGPGFDTSLYTSSPASRQSMASHALTSNFTVPYTNRSIVDI